MGAQGDRGTHPRILVLQNSGVRPSISTFYFPRVEAVRRGGLRLGEEYR